MEFLNAKRIAAEDTVKTAIVYSDELWDDTSERCKRKELKVGPKAVFEELDENRRTRARKATQESKRPEGQSNAYAGRSSDGASYQSSYLAGQRWAGKKDWWEPSSAASASYRQSRW